MYLKVLLMCLASVLSVLFSLLQKDGIVKVITREMIKITTINSIRVKPFPEKLQSPNFKLQPFKLFGNFLFVIFVLKSGAVAKMGIDFALGNL